MGKNSRDLRNAALIAFVLCGLLTFLANISLASDERTAWFDEILRNEKFENRRGAVCY